MSLLETIAQMLRGGPPTLTCAACGQEVSGDDLGAAIAPDADLYWCRPCNTAGLVPDEV